MMVSSLNRINQIGLDNLVRILLLDDSDETLFKSITKEQLVWIFADSEC
jgi:hypothetical protein